MKSTMFVRRIFLALTDHYLEFLETELNDWEDLVMGLPVGDAIRTTGR